MEERIINNIITKCSRVNLTLTVLLIMYNLLRIIAGENNDKKVLIVLVVILAIDIILNFTFFAKHLYLWKMVRCIELCLCAYTFVFFSEPYSFVIVSQMISVIIFEMLFTLTDYSDNYMRIITIILTMVILIISSVIRMLFTSYDPYIICGVAFGMIGICVFTSVASEMLMHELEFLAVKYRDQVHRADSTDEINSELKLTQEKYKSANETLAKQTIRLEAAYKRINAANTEMILQNDILKKLSSSLNVQSLIDEMTHTLRSELDLSACAIYLLPDKSQDDLEMTSIDLSDNIKNKTDLGHALFGGIMNNYARDKKLLVDNHVTRDKYPFAFDDTVASAMIMPVIKDNTPVGSLFVAKERFDFFIENRVFFDNTVAQFMVALENARLYSRMQEMAITDGLTGIYNRGHLNLLMDQFSKQALRDQTPLSVALFDIDHFKHVNDTYGHLFGDLVIKTVASFANETARANGGIAARYGGEEFVMAFPGKKVNDVYRISDELRMKIGNKKLDNNGIMVSVNVSVGVTGCPETCKLHSDLLNHADWSMYYSKEHGRNRVTIDSDEIIAFGNK